MGCLKDISARECCHSSHWSPHSWWRSMLAPGDANTFSWSVWRPKLEQRKIEASGDESSHQVPYQETGRPIDENMVELFSFLVMRLDAQDRNQSSAQRHGLYACLRHRWSCSMYTKKQIPWCCEAGLHQSVDLHSWHGCHSPCGGSSWMPRHRWAVGCLRYQVLSSSRDSPDIGAWQVLRITLISCLHWVWFCVMRWRQEQKDCMGDVEGL